MANDPSKDVAEFLDDLVSDLTGMHVKAAQWSLAPTDQDAVDELAKLPAGLIERAQALRARLDDAGGDGSYFTEGAKPKGVAEDKTGDPKPKAKAKPKAAAGKR